jgi:hypothetical protein
MIVKYGRIGNTELDRREVSTKFRTLIDFGDVVFGGVKGAQDLFDSTEFELYRSHWAVREGNVTAILRKLAELKPELADAVATQLAPDQAVVAAEPPPRTKNTIGGADSVERFLPRLWGRADKAATEIFFAADDNRWRMVYFSAVTITTLGYGDIVPITHGARNLVTAEAVAGVILIGLFLNAVAKPRRTPSEMSY